MPTKLYEAEHPYHCAEGNYFSNDWTFRSGSWADFVADWGSADEDYNLVFRWDWRIDRDDDELPTDAGKRGDGVLQVCYVLQRKGIFSAHFVTVKGEDEPAVREWLAKKCEHMKRIWSPLA